MSEKPEVLPIAPDGEPTSRRRVILLATLIFVVTAAAYIPAMRGAFIWDDRVSVFENPLIHARDGLRRIWFTNEAIDYWPLTYTMHWFEWRIWRAHPEPYHVANILLHAASAVVLWRVLRRLKMRGAFLAALVFGVHPVAVASVAWITERKNTLSMLLYLLTALAYLRFEDEGGRRWHTAALFLFAAALLAKTSVVMLPFVLLLLAWWRRGRIDRTDVRRAVPFFAMSLVMGLVTIWFHYGRLAGIEAPRPEGLLSRVAAAGWIAWFYIWKVLAPVRLAAMYPRWDVDGSRLVSFVPLILLGGCLAVLWVYRRRWGKAPLLGLGYFLLMLAPVLGFLNMSFMKYSLVADHLQYVPMIGVIALVSAGITVGALRLTARRAPLYVAAAALVGLLAVMTFRQAALYQDQETFWSHTIALNDKALGAYNNRGMVRFLRGRFDQALEDFSRAIELKPDSAKVHNNRARVHFALGQLDQALRDYSQAIKLKPDDAFAYHSRGACYVQRGEFDKAARDFSEAIRIAPRVPEAYFNRAQMYFQMKAYEKARADVDAYQRLGRTVDPAFLEALRRASSGPGSR